VGGEVITRREPAYRADVIEHGGDHDAAGNIDLRHGATVTTP
jgi:hypothetical protein